MTSRTAACSCGQLRIEVQGEPRGVGVCHCLACQRRTGSVFATLASFSAPFTVTGTATEYVRVGDQGAKFTFSFCPVCGTTVFHTEEGYEQSKVSVAVGALADPGFPAPRLSMYECRRHPWVQMPDGIRTFDKDPAQVVTEDRTYWFPAKKFGWGWGPPITWQGWMVVVTWLAMLLVGVLVMESRRASLPGMLVYILLMGGVLMLICYWKGEPPKWRFGDRSNP